MMQLVVDNPLVSFQNKGMIEAAAITTLGVNVKESDNPIGYFGTGLKYAIAIILRGGGEVTIWRGTEEFTFGTKVVNIRGKDFQLITMNGDELGFTTEMGKNWKPWQAFREIYCNALDEGGVVRSGFLEPREGYTTVHVRSEAILRAYADRNLIVLNSDEICISQGVRIHPYIFSAIYYRGIRVKHLEKKSIFTYNIIGHRVQLTEDRTIASMFDVSHIITSAIASCTNTGVIRAVLKAPEGSWEANMDFTWVSGLSSEFKEVVKDCFTNKEDINNTAIAACKEHMDLSSLKPPKADLSISEKERLDYAINVCKESGLNMDLYDVHVVEHLDSHVWGMADRATNTIFLPRNLLEQSPDIVVQTIMEEHVHLHTGYSDGTRNMQTHLGLLWAKGAIRIYEGKA